MPHRKTLPSLEAWRTLLALVETGSVTAAARQLGVKQPVVSRKLKVFQQRQRFGQLLDADKGLTDAGEAALPAVRELIHRHDHLLEYLEGISQAPEQLRVGLGQFPARFYLPRVLYQLRERIDQCELITEVVRGEERILAVADGGMDLAIVTHSPALIEEIFNRKRQGGRIALKIDRLGKHPLGLVAAKHNPEGQALSALPEERAVALEQLRNWELVGLDQRSGVRRQLEERFPPHEIRFIAEGGGWWVALECARQGVGVAVIPLAIVSCEDQQELVLRRLADRFSLQDYLIHRDQPLSAFQKLVKSAFRTSARDHQKAVQSRWG